MKEKEYQEIRRKYIEAYPHLAHIKNTKVFAQNALRLTVLKTVNGIELLKLSELC